MKRILKVSLLQRFPSSLSCNRHQTTYPVDGEVGKESISSEQELPAFQKNFLHLINTESSLSEQAAKKFRLENRIFLDTDTILNPTCQFSDINFPSYVQHWLKTTNFKTPTAVQAQSWPMILKGDNVIGNAPTGTGKTMAYLLPALIHAENRNMGVNKDGPAAIVLAPTLELVHQIRSVTADVTRNSNLKTISLGSGSLSQEGKNETKEADICIATPGKLASLSQENKINIDQCSYLVLDEVDVLLNRKFASDTYNIFRRIRPDSQIVMFSAVAYSNPNRLWFAKNIVRMSVGGDQPMVSPTIKQEFLFCSIYEKEDKLVNIIKSHEQEKVLIFANNTSSAHALYHLLREEKIFVRFFHGKSMQRRYSLDGFSSGSKQVLIATDLGSRGLDIPNVDMVINYDMPFTITDYINRIGRTGRAENEGKAISFITRYNSSIAPELETLLMESNQNVPRSLKNLAKLEEIRKDEQDQVQVHKYF